MVLPILLEEDNEEEGLKSRKRIDSSGSPRNPIGRIIANPGPFFHGGLPPLGRDAMGMGEEAETSLGGRALPY